MTEQFILVESSVLTLFELFFPKFYKFIWNEIELVLRKNVTF